MLAHSGTLRQFAEFARETGLDLQRLDPDLLAGLVRSQSEDRIPAQLVVDTLQCAAGKSGRQDLGIAFISWTNLRRFSPFSLFWDICPTIADLVRLTARYAKLENEAFSTRVLDEGKEVALCHYVLTPGRLGSTQYIQASFALEMRLFRSMFGEGWHPKRLDLDHPAPADVRRHRSIFGCPINWNADRNAMIVAKSDMHRPSPHANRQMLDYLEKHVDVSACSPETNFLQRVDSEVAAHLAGGRATARTVASLVALSGRTFQRRLSENGVTFAELLRRARVRAAEQYFSSETSPNLSELSYRLGYGEASAVSRFLRKNFGAGLKCMKQRRARDTPFSPDELRAHS